MVSFFFFLFLSHRLQQFPTQRKLLMPLAAKKDSKKHHCNHHQSTDDLNSLVVHIPKFTLSTTHFGDPKNQRNHFQNAHSWHSCHFHNPQNDSETSGKQNKMIKLFKLLKKTLFVYHKVAMISKNKVTPLGLILDLGQCISRIEASPFPYRVEGFSRHPWGRFAGLGDVKLVGKLPTHFGS